ncbi:MAG: hypothetical protein PWQ87_265 [Candidatus Woesearchaeota archaeon]|nr:hypothetical protein [Candidatus Woesearchaeota archaeon]
MGNEESGELERKIKEIDSQGRIDEIIEKYDKLTDYFIEDKDSYEMEKKLFDSVYFLVNNVEDLKLVEDFLEINEKYQRNKRTGSKKSYFEFLSNISSLFSEFDNLSKKGAEENLKKITTKSIGTLMEVLNKYGQEEDMIEDLEIISSAAKRMIMKNPYKTAKDSGAEWFCNCLKLFVRDSVLSAREKFSYEKKG